MTWIDRLTGRAQRAQQQQAQSQIAVLERQVQALQEDLGFSYDPDASLSATGGGSLYFRRLSSSDRDLSPMDQERMLKTARFLAETNPGARRVLETTRDYCVGDGWSIEAEEPDDEGLTNAMQGVIDRFVADPYQQLDHWLYDLVLEWATDGELCLPVSVNDKDGSVRLGYVDPAQIIDVLPNPRNPKEPLAVIVKRPGMLVEKDYYRVVHQDDRPTSPTYQRMIGTDTNAAGEPMALAFAPGGTQPIQWSGACFFWKLNAPTSSRRGRSDLLSLADWLDALDQLLFGEVDRALLMKAFIWDVTIKGGTDETISAYLKKNSNPKPASVRAHNDSVAWEAVTPDLKTADAQIGADLLTSQVATGAGLPKTWLNGLMDTNRATAAEMSEPAFKRLTGRQRQVRHLLEEITTFVLDQAELAGKLPHRSQQEGSVQLKPWGFSVNMPEIRPKDMQVAATTAQALVQALTTALADKAISEDVYQRLMVLIAEQFGLDVDLDQMQADIEQATADAEAKAAVAPYGGMGGAGEQPSQQGQQGPANDNGAANGAAQFGRGALSPQSPAGAG